MQDTEPNRAAALEPGRWRRSGAEAGRRNEPRTAITLAPAQQELQAAWLAAVHGERLQFLAAVAELDARRGVALRNLGELRAQAVADARQRAALPMLQQEVRALDAARDGLMLRFAEAVEALIDRASDCDAAWRAGNSQQRDRRLVLPATVFVVPADVLSVPPDPFA